MNLAFATIEKLEERRLLAVAYLSEYSPMTVGSWWMYDKIKDGKRLSPHREGEAYRKVQRGWLFALVGNPVPVAIFAPSACYVHGVRKSVLVAIRLAFIWNAVVVLVWLSACAVNGAFLPGLIAVRGCP